MPVWLAPSLPSGHMDSFLGWRGRGGVLWYTSFPSALAPFFPHPSHLHSAMMMRDTAKSMLLCSETVQGINPADWEGEAWEAVCNPLKLGSAHWPQLEPGFSSGLHGEKEEDLFSHYFLCLSAPFCCGSAGPTWLLSSL